MKSPPAKSTVGKPTMAQRIARALPTLSRAHHKIADHVLSHPLQVATLPIDELAAVLEVSVATVNRFARALDFPGYPQFRAALVLGFESALAPVEKLRHRIENPATTVDVFSSALADIQRNIGLTQQALEAESCEQAVKAILGATRIRIIGFGASSWLGGLLQRNLDSHCDDVQLLANIEGSSFAARMLSRLQATDLLIVIGFPRYSADAVFLTQRAADAGIPVLAITDRPTSPLAPLAKTALYVQTNSEYFSNCEASALALIEALCSAVAHHSKASVDGATKLAESVLPWIYESNGSGLRPATSAARKASKKKAKQDVKK